MKTIEIKGWIFAKPDQYSKGIKYEFSDFDYEKATNGGYGVGQWKAYKKIAEHTITIEIANEVDPVALLIAGLEGERNQLRAEFTRKVNEINDRIQSLQAIEYTPQEAS